MDKIRSIIFKAISWIFKKEMHEEIKAALSYYQEQQQKRQYKVMITENKVQPIKIKYCFIAPPVDGSAMYCPYEKRLEDIKEELLEDAKKHISVKQFGREVTLKLTVLPKDWDEQ